MAKTSFLSPETQGARTTEARARGGSALEREVRVMAERAVGVSQVRETRAFADTGSRFSRVADFLQQPASNLGEQLAGGKFHSGLSWSGIFLRALGIGSAAALGVFSTLAYFGAIALPQIFIPPALFTTAFWLIAPSLWVPITIFVGAGLLFGLFSHLLDRGLESN
ncbi:MAG: hypothetical protein AAB573_00325 [Patescibacteria group bacterium]